MLTQTPWAAAYTASKFGLRGFSAALRGELHDHPRIHICDVYPIFVATPALGHTGNYTGAKLAWPPGALAPETVADAVVRLARRPRPTTAVGLPAAVLQAGGLANPVAAPLMSRFLASWSQRAEYAPDTTGTMYAPPATPSGIDGGSRQPGRQRSAALAVGAAMVAGAIGMRLVRGRA
jgi:NAD(P)-dependent dehydrogenase (short-subunit alcohol dehydrogenase family)